MDPFLLLNILTYGLRKDQTINPPLPSPLPSINAKISTKMPLNIICILSKYIICMDHWSIYKKLSYCDSHLVVCVCVCACAGVCVCAQACVCVHVCVADALCTGCNWPRGADWDSSLACYQTDGKPERTAVSLWETQQTREAGNNTNRRGRHMWTDTHMRAQTHATAVTLTGCDSEENVSNVLLLDSLKDDG